MTTVREIQKEIAELLIFIADYYNFDDDAGLTDIASRLYRITDKL